MSTNLDVVEIASGVKIKEGNLDFGSSKAAWINEQTKPRNEEDTRIEEIKINGFTVFENCFSTEDLEYARKKIDEIYEIQVNEVGGQEKLYDIGDANIARQLLVYDDYFLKHAAYDKVIKIVNRFLGDYYILYQQNANLHMPNEGHTTTPWHRDPTFKHYTSSRPLYMTALHIIDDYTEENGGIHILPGSHLHEPFPSFDYVDKYKQFVTLKAGSIVLFDSMMFHSPGVNKSNTPKRSLPHFYAIHMMRQEISIPQMLNGKWSDDEFLRQFLGYNHQTFYNVKDYRMERYKNKRKDLPVY